MNYRQVLDTHMRNRVLFSEPEIMYDVVFIINVNSRGWILEKICRVIEANSSLNCYFLFTERNDSLTYDLPKARSYFFAHYAMAYSSMVRHPEILGGNIYVWFTHPDLSKGITLEDLGVMLNACTHVFTPCSINRDIMQLIGVNPGKISVPLGGADPDLFTASRRKGTTVGFVGAYYPRKMPEKMLALMKSMPDVEFLLVAPRAQDVENKGILWSAWPGFMKMRKLANLRIVEAPFEEFPALYEEMDVYVSLSELEGGPIPIIEAMMSNVIPVATRTGFADDVISHGKNGYVLDVDADLKQIEAVIRAALQDTDADIRADALDYSWSNFGSEIADKLVPCLSVDRPVMFGSLTGNQYFLRAGWNHVDFSGAWACSNSVELFFDLEHPAPAGLSLTLDLWPGLLDHTTPLHVNADLNGVTHGSKTLPPKGRTSLSYDVPEGATTLRLSLTFEGQDFQTMEGEKMASGIKILSANLAVKEPALEPNTAPVAQDLTLLDQMEEPKNPDSKPPIWSRLSRLGLFKGPLFSSHPDLASPVAEKLPAVTCSDSAVLDFSLEGNGTPYLVRGWHPPEPGGVWTSEKSGDLAVWLAPDVLKGKTKFTIFGRVFGAAAEDVSRIDVTIKAGSESVSASYLCDTDEPRMLELDLPSYSDESDGLYKISITRSACFVPAQLDMRSADHRNLGFCLIKAEIM